MIKDYLIKKLGGYTGMEYAIITDRYEGGTYLIAELRNTISELQALIPAPVIPKKRGRPRKIV